MPRPDALIPRLTGALVGQIGPEGLKTAALLSGLEALSYPQFSQLVGRLAQARLPAPLVQAVIRWYIKRFDVDTSEMAHPPEHYQTFDDFFTRELKAGIHTVDPDPAVAVSPVDGRILNFGAVSEGHIDQVKGRSYPLEELLDSATSARRFCDGHYVTIYLSPRDYHRIHCPVDGRVVSYRYVPGRLYPVNQYGVRHVARVFAVNERLISYVKSELGEFAIVKVGATNVGKITCSYHPVRTNEGRKTGFDEHLKKSVKIGRGDELGMFHLGSTVVVVAANPRVSPIASIQTEQFLRMGQPLFRRR